MLAFMIDDKFSLKLWTRVSYNNAVAPLVDLEEYQYPLVQSCIFQKMVATSDDVRKASADAERRLDSHFLMCSLELACFVLLQLSIAQLCESSGWGRTKESNQEEALKPDAILDSSSRAHTRESRSFLSVLSTVIRKREDVYRVIKAFENRGEWLGPEAKRYVQCLVCKGTDSFSLRNFLFRLLLGLSYVCFLITNLHSVLLHTESSWSPDGRSIS
ncbi:thimet oligopeptidase [Dendrobium catenatum]|uniref:Thimet oligopeptidase n=1 Tax=Dendrobium catenatum TaxID=906689 RepID=A0A2I0VDP6_9ASPA|nr:thimet oligopeptidase [Dendrobium catenatum]